MLSSKVQVVSNNHVFSTDTKTLCYLRSVVPNRGAAAHKGVVKRCQGCRQTLNLLPFKFFFTTMGGPNWHFSQVRVP